MYQKIELIKNSIYESWIIYIKDFVNVTDQDMKEMKLIMPTEFHKIKIFDKLINLPRLQQSYGQDYAYSGTISKSIKDFPPFISILLKKINAFHKKMTNTNEDIYKMCLVNWYRDGNDYIGFHSDDEKQIIPGAPIYSVSIGATRKFKLKSKVEGGIDYTIDLTPGSLVIMCGDCQRTHQHSVTKSKSNEMRINFTFRAFE
jgi:alkylated DNA repair dioxygenase AlkB